jgi:hypothetical protein
MVVEHPPNEQEQLLSAFKSNLADAGLYTPSSEATKASHDDVTILYVGLLTDVPRSLSFGEQAIPPRKTL